MPLQNTRMPDGSYPTPRIVVYKSCPMGVGSCVVGGKVSPQNQTAIMQGSRFIYLDVSHNLKNEKLCYLCSRMRLHSRYIF